MIKIRMKKDHTGSSDGFSTMLYKADSEYLVSDRLGDIFIKQLNIATEIIDEGENDEEIEKEKKTVNKKSEPKGYANKMMNKKEEDDE